MLCRKKSKDGLQVKAHLLNLQPEDPAMQANMLCQNGLYVESVAPCTEDAHGTSEEKGESFGAV